MEKDKFNFEAFKEDAKAGQGLLGAEGAFTALMKNFLEEILEGELEAHISESEHPNRKNGKGKKKVRTSLGEVELDTPRDRQGIRIKTKPLPRI